jgi:hypothetical protein
MGYPFTEIYFKSYIEKIQIAKYSNSLFSTEHESWNEMKICLKMSSEEKMALSRKLNMKTVFSFYFTFETVRYYHESNATFPCP